MLAVRRWRLLLAAGGFGRTAYAQQAAEGGVASAEHYCWVTGLIEDDQERRVLDSSFGGGDGHLAMADAYTVPSSDGLHIYAHQKGSDGKTRRFGDWFDWVYQQAIEDAAGRAQWSDCRGQVLDLGVERAFLRPLDKDDGLSFAGTACDPGAPGGSEDWVLDLSRFAMADDDKDFGDYAGGYGDMFRPCRKDNEADVGLRPVGVNERVATGTTDTDASLAGGDNPYYVAGVSHPTRSQLVDMLFYQSVSSRLAGDPWHRLRGAETTAGFDRQTLARGRWSTRSVGVPDGDILESVQVRCIDPSNPDGGDQVDPALLAL